MILKHWRKFLPLIGIILFVYILIKIDVTKVIKEIGSMNLGYFLYIIPLVAIFIGLQTLKWFVLAKKQKINLSFMKAVKINLICNFYGFITPSKLGSVIRADYLRKYTDGIGKGLSNFVLDKVLDLSSLFFLGAVLSFIFREKIGNSAIIYPFIMLIIIVGLTLIFLKKERTHFLLGFIYRKVLPAQIREKAKVTFNSFYEDMPSKKFLMFAWLLNIIAWIELIFLNYIIGLSIGINLTYLHYLAIMPISTIVAQIPISISGLGVREAAMISLFGLFGISAVKVFSLSMIDIAVLIIIPSFIGFLISLTDKQEEKESI